jgi:hypothetical protein
VSPLAIEMFKGIQRQTDRDGVGRVDDSERVAVEREWTGVVCLACEQPLHKRV